MMVADSACGYDGDSVEGVSSVMTMFMEKVVGLAQNFEAQMEASPMVFEKIEREVTSLFAEGQGLFLAGLLAANRASKARVQKAQQARLDYVIALRSGQQRPIQIRLAMGFKCQVTTTYCQPKSMDYSKLIPGLDIDLSVYGFQDGVSPGLVSKVTRAVALSPSLDQAYQELERDGCQLTRSVMDRLVTRTGEEFLTVRERMLELFESGKMPEGTEFAGQKVSIQIDGGRTRTRSKLTAICPAKNLGKKQSEVTGQESLGRAKEKRRKGSFQADWREPKVFTIYVHDSHGRKHKKFREVIDGSFADADYIERLIAMQIYRQGAHRASSITLVSDGAAWIWGRIDSILKAAQVRVQTQIYRVLDVYHACENLSKGLKALGAAALGTGEDQIDFRGQRSRLRDGHWKEVSSTLEDVLRERGEDRVADAAEVRRVVDYLRRHGEAGHLDYPSFSLLGLPLGSGAIESTIRRVVNLRMKGNGVFWRLPKAECMLVLRGSILSDRWDEDRTRAKEEMLKNRQLAMPPIDETPRPKSEARLESPESQGNA
jgi:hypothetical protein